MNHPASTDPADALYPGAANTAGGRLFELVKTVLPGYALDDHLRAFERRNVLLDVRWSRTRATRVGAEVRASLATTPGRSVVLLGREVRRVARVPAEWPWILPRRMPGGWIARCLPHPSGLNRWYNDPTCREVAALMLAELAAAELGRQVS